MLLSTIKAKSLLTSGNLGNSSKIIFSFNEFFKIKYSHLDEIMTNIGDDKDIIELFDNLYKEIRTNIRL